MLAKRVLSALIALAIVLGAIFVAPRAGTFLVLIAIVAMAAWEWGTLMTSRRAPAAVAYALLAVVVFVGVLWLTADSRSGRDALLAGAIVFWIVAFAVVLKFPVDFAPAVTFVVGLLILVPSFTALAAVFDSDKGDFRLLMFLGIIWAADVGAYFFGRRFGRIRLAPLVSPGKSWEGVLGGVTAAGLVGAGGAAYLGMPVTSVVVLAVVVALVSVVGDLTISMFKRNAGVKDSGKLFPGHGGMLDRVDSICAGAPLFALALPLIVD